MEQKVTNRNIPRVSMIVAVTLDWGIGRNGKLLYRISEDLKRFKELTTDNVVIMGYNTYNTCVGRALPNRINYVIDQKRGIPEGGVISENGVNFVSCVEDAIINATDIYPDKEIFIIGGAYVYSYCLSYDYIGKLYLTCIYKDLSEEDGVVRLFEPLRGMDWLSRPYLDRCEWTLVSLSASFNDYKNGVKYDFREYVRNHQY